MPQRYTGISYYIPKKFTTLRCKMTNESIIRKIDCSPFFDLINEIESGEANSSIHWNPINMEARFAERVMAYEKIFYQYLDEIGLT
jgi:hypothetical protein